MPFEIFDSSADDQDAELLAAEADWPEELSLLASQLSADAARLSAMYPARAELAIPCIEKTELPAVATSQSAQATSQSASATSLSASAAARWLASARVPRWIAAAAVLALASVAAVSTYRSPDRGALAEPAQRPAVQVAVNGRAVHGDAAAQAPQDAVILFEETGFENLSSPAQEALLDLFEDDQLAQASLSI